MKNEIVSQLRSTLVRLEKTYQKMMATQSYNQDIERIKILHELVKEQVNSENSDRTTRSNR
jgi:hypothetical protein